MADDWYQWESRVSTLPAAFAKVLGKSDAFETFAAREDARPTSVGRTMATRHKAAVLADVVRGKEKPRWQSQRGDET